MFTEVSQYAKNVDLVMLLIVGIAAILLLGITGVMIYFVIRYNRKRNPNPAQIEGNRVLEIIWVVVPVILVLGMFYFGYVTFKESRYVPPGAMEIKVEAKMWVWKFTYPNGKVTDTLFIPSNKPIKFTITSVDVNHSFYIPAFRIKEDAVPGRKNYMVVNSKGTGVFDIACAEYCGLNHSLMYSKVYVVPEKEFALWYEGKATDDFLKLYLANHTSNYKDLLSSSYAILFAKGCVQCHSLDGSKSIAPSFVDLKRGMAHVKSEGKDTMVAIDKDYLRRSIMYPDIEQVVGFDKVTMPQQLNKVNDSELEQIVELLYNKFAKRN